MKIRKDSPFFGITEKQIDFLLVEAENYSVDQIADEWERDTGKEVTTEAMRRFLVRLKRHRALFPATEEDPDSGEELVKFAERAADGKARDGLIEAARQRLFEEALEKGDSAALLELYRAANEERAREREVEVEKKRVEVEQRKAAVAEENARIGWRKVEVLAGRATERALLNARVVSRKVLEGTGNYGMSGKDGNDEGVELLPFLRAVLAEEGVEEAQKLARVREILAAGKGGPKLLGVAVADSMKSPRRDLKQEARK